MAQRKLRHPCFTFGGACDYKNECGFNYMFDFGKTAGLR